MKQKFAELLLSTGRPGAETVLNNLDRIGFFEAPASTRFHLPRRGGLLEHSINVCDTALKIRDIFSDSPDILARIPRESVIIAALLHDVCKADIYKEGSRNVKNPVTGVWETVPTFDVDFSRLPCGHGQKSVIRLLKWGFDLTEDEILAILWHMGAWDLPLQSAEEKGNMSAAYDKCPLLSILQASDNIASHILEAKKD